MAYTLIITENGGVNDKCVIISEKCQGFLNGMALLIMALRMMVGFAVLGLTAFGTLVKCWNDYKFSFKKDMCSFAYTTHEKTLIELRMYVQGFPLEEFDKFMIMMDVTAPVSDWLAKDMTKNFIPLLSMNY